jgi:hypothetical protein
MVTAIAFFWSFMRNPAIRRGGGTCGASNIIYKCGKRLKIFGNI